MRFIYDVETYPNYFCVTFAAVNCDLNWYFEISDWCDDSSKLNAFMRDSGMHDDIHIGFNNLGFDYPLLHHMLRVNCRLTAEQINARAQEIIRENNENRFGVVIWPSDRQVKQIDLFKIWHFDNRAKMTSLKALEFNMRVDNVEDLPFPFDKRLTQEQAAIVHAYNLNDIDATRRFYKMTIPAIELREKLSEKYSLDFTNANDTKIGAQVFEKRLSDVGITCYDFSSQGRKPRQTIRNSIALGECVPSYIFFNDHEFNRILSTIRSKIITETKGAFEDLSCRFNGLSYVFGTGGIHASVENRIFQSDTDHIIVDADVTSMYPSIAIVNKYYPEHLGTRFIDVYSDLLAERKSHGKGTPENAALKLALNGVYGKSNDQYSIFYDSLFTMKVTITGQMCLAMLAEHLTKMVTNIEIIQLNTDGITARIPRDALDVYKDVCSQWEHTTQLQLEYAWYSRMWIRDVNNYIAEYSDGKVKRKGAYEYDIEMHQNASSLVIQKVAEQVLLHNAPIRETVVNWPDKMDFMLRVKVPRSSKLLGVKGGVDYQLANMTRYYVAKDGYALVKQMPPLKGKTESRRIGVCSGWTVCVCNKIEHAVAPVDFEYYINEVEKLVLMLRED